MKIEFHALSRFNFIVGIVCGHRPFKAGHFNYSATRVGFDKRSRRKSENKVAKMDEDAPLFRGNTTLLHRDAEAISLGGFSNRRDFSCPRRSISFVRGGRGRM